MAAGSLRDVEYQSCADEPRTDIRSVGLKRSQLKNTTRNGLQVCLDNSREWVSLRSGARPSC
jgi:hypothetical protein